MNSPSPNGPELDPNKDALSGTSSGTSSGTILMNFLLGIGLYLGFACLNTGLWNLSIGAIGGPALGIVSGVSLFTLVILVTFTCFATCLNMWRQGQPVTYTMPLTVSNGPPVEKYYMVNEDLELVETTKEYLLNQVQSELNSKLSEAKKNKAGTTDGTGKVSQEGAGAAPNDGSNDG